MAEPAVADCEVTDCCCVLPRTGCEDEVALEATLLDKVPVNPVPIGTDELAVAEGREMGRKGPAVLMYAGADRSASSTELLAVIGITISRALPWG